MKGKDIASTCLSVSPINIYIYIFFILDLKILLFILLRIIPLHWKLVFFIISFVVSLAEFPDF